MIDEPNAMRTWRERIEALVARALAGAAGANSGLTAGDSTVVWRPGGVTSGNVFATWPEVVAAVSKMNGDITIALDASLAAAVIPAGNWDLRPAGVNGPVGIVNGTKNNPAPFITIANAPVTLKGLTGLRDVQVDNQSTANVITPSIADQYEFYMEGGAAIYQNALSGGHAFFGAALRLWMRDFSFISTLDTGTNALQNSAGTIIEIEAGSTLDTNQFQSAGAIVTVSGPSVPFSNPPYQPQAGAPTVVPQGMKINGSTAIDPATGKTAVIPTFISTQTRIECTQRTAVGDAGTIRYAALLADRVNGNPGSFKISALSAAGGGAVHLGDSSVVDWEVTIFG